MNKKSEKSTIIVILIAIIALVVVIGASNQYYGKPNNTSHKNYTSSSKDNSVSDDEKDATPGRDKGITGSYRDDNLGAAMLLFSDGTGRYVFYDPKNGNTDDRLTWKKIGLNGTGHMQYKLNFHDSDIKSSIIATVKDEYTIILTSSDTNWRTETMHQTRGRLDLNKFLKNGPDNNMAQIENHTTPGEQTTDQVLSNGISESEARKKLESSGISANDMKATRIQNGWSFRNHDDPFGVGRYTVLDDGTINKN